MQSRLRLKPSMHQQESKEGRKMGKPTGFMEYERCEASSVEPKERIKNFNEFHVFLSRENQQKQAARCMAECHSASQDLQLQG